MGWGIWRDSTMSYWTKLLGEIWRIYHNFLIPQIWGIWGDNVFLDKNTLRKSSKPNEWLFSFVMSKETHANSVFLPHDQTWYQLHLLFSSSIQVILIPSIHISYIGFSMFVASTSIFCFIGFVLKLSGSIHYSVVQRLTVHSFVATHARIIFNLGFNGFYSIWDLMGSIQCSNHIHSLSLVSIHSVNVWLLRFPDHIYFGV